MAPDIPPLRVLPRQVAAPCFNQVRLALRRIGCPLRLPLTRHRGLEVVLARETWLCIDALSNDLPVLAWRDFQARRRAALHHPVDCRLYLYHLHAGLIMGSALEALERAVRSRLDGTGSSA